MAGTFPRFSPASFDRLLDRTATATGVPRDRLIAADTTARTSRARFAACWASVHGIGASAFATAKLLGGRNHSTILHALRRAEQLRTDDPTFRALTDGLVAACANRGER